MNLTTLIPAALAAILLAGAAHAAPQPAAVKPVLNIQVCNPRGNCLEPDSNGPALSGRAVHAAVKPVLSIMVCTKNCLEPDTNGPALSGLAKASAVVRPLSPPPFLTKG